MHFTTQWLRINVPIMMIIKQIILFASCFWVTVKPAILDKINGKPKLPPSPPNQGWENGVFLPFARLHPWFREGGVGMGYAVPSYFVQDRGLTDTRFIRTPHYYGQFALSLGKESPYIFSKFNTLNTDTFHGPFSVGFNGLWLYFLE